MLSEKKAKWLLHLVLPLFIALFSIFICAKKVPDTKFYNTTIESLDESKDVVAKLTGGTTGLSLVIDFLPQDYGSSLANSLAGFDKYFVFLLIAIFLERIIIIEGTVISFTYLIPTACGLYALAFLIKKKSVAIFAKKIAAFAIAIILVVPCGTHLANAIGQSYLEYVNETIDNAAQYSSTISDELTESDENDSQTLVEKFQNAISSAITSIKDIADNIKVVITKFMNSIAILIVTTCIVPAAMFWFLLWIFQQLFSIDFSGSFENLMKYEKRLEKKNETKAS